MNEPVQNKRGRPAKAPAPARNPAQSPAKSPTAGPAKKPAKTAAATPEAAETGRTNDPERTQADILDVATREFADKGYAGARVDDMAAAMRTSKRMIYYYFGSKDGLYIAVLEQAYRRIRAHEASLHLDDLEPEEALRKLVGATVDYHRAHPDFTRLVMTENIHRGEFIRRSSVIQQLNVPAIDAVHRIYQRGVAAKAFRAGVDPVDLHMSISALALFQVANKHTFSLIFKRDPDLPAALTARRKSIVETIVRFVRL